MTFIQTAPWLKLIVGTRLASCQPRGTVCPLDGHQETVRHATLHCKFLQAAFHIAKQCLGPVQPEDETVDDLEVILWEQPKLSVSTPLGTGVGVLVGSQSALAAWVCP